MSSWNIRYIEEQPPVHPSNSFFSLYYHIQLCKICYLTYRMYVYSLSFYGTDVDNARTYYTNVLRINSSKSCFNQRWKSSQGQGRHVYIHSTVSFVDRTKETDGKCFIVIAYVYPPHIPSSSYLQLLDRCESIVQQVSVYCSVTCFSLQTGLVNN